MSVKFGLWAFHKFRKGRKILTLLTFGCPSSYTFQVKQPSGGALIL